MSISREAMRFTQLAGEFAKRSVRKPTRGALASEPRNTAVEKRGAMPDCKSLVSTLLLTSSLTLLASVLVAPIRTSGFAAASSQPDCHRNSPLSPGQPTARLSAATDTDAAPEVNALFPENEEQDGADALDEPRVAFLIPCSFRNVPDRQLIAPRSILSLYPLRC
jgi:hypothetical protein